jgi:DNA polymerase-3 subunit delta
MIYEGDYMNFGELKTRLKKGDISRLYLLSGEESYYIQKAEEAILNTLFPKGYMLRMYSL